ncbi:MAG TPA: MarR family transcriptional regulator [Gammaproteobacteria bacterium]|nr:MarR family transcriptional regulator [Gammaproteobacteria bacterium]
MAGKRRAKTNVSARDYRTVGLWREALRDFIHFSNKDMKRQGITLLQYQVLLEIVSCLETEEEMTVGTLSSHLHMRHNSVVVLINQLARKGHVRRVPSPSDRRSMLLQLTAKGKRTLDKLVQGHGRVIDAFLPRLRKALASPGN